jgi:20S proteasome subunit beta 1
VLTLAGSGSTYVYGYCDATYQDGWGEAETIQFVKNSASAHSVSFRADPSALALAMARDGSSGGCIRMCVITEDKVERHFVPGNELPRFWEGKEVIGGLAQTTKPVAAA